TRDLGPNREHRHLHSRRPTSARPRRLATQPPCGPDRTLAIGTIGPRCRASAHVHRVRNAEHQRSRSIIDAPSSCLLIYAQASRSVSSPAWGARLASALCRLPVSVVHERVGVQSKRPRAADSLGEVLMLLQSWVSIVTVVLVAARAVNML